MERAQAPVARRFRRAESVVVAGLVAIPAAALVTAALEVAVGAVAYGLFGAVLASWVVALLVFDVLSYEPGSTGEYDDPSGAGCVAVMFATVGGSWRCSHEGSRTDEARSSRRQRRASSPC